MTLFTRIEDRHKSPIYEPTGLFMFITLERILVMYNNVLN